MCNMFIVLPYVSTAPPFRGSLSEHVSTPVWPVELHSTVPPVRGFLSEHASTPVWLVELHSIVDLTMA